MLYPVEVGHFPLQCLVLGEGAIGHARSGSAGAPPRGSRLGRCYAARVVGQSEIIVGTGENDSPALNDTLGRRKDLLGDCAERRHTLIGQFRLEVGHGPEFVKQHESAPYWLPG